MFKHLLLISFLFSTLFVASVQASSIQTKAAAQWEEELLTQLDLASVDEHKRFSFVQSSNDNKKKRVSKYSPDASPEWTLLSVDGRSPSANDVKTFRKDQAKEQERNGDSRFRDLVLAGSVEIVGIDDVHVRLSFQPIIGDFDDEANSNYAGSAIFNVLTNQLLEIDIQSSGSFSPQFSFTISNMRLYFSFIHQDGFALTKEYLFNMEAKIGGIKSLNIDSATNYSDYQLQ